ncbi:MAG: NAD(P)-dependent oxidoreductase [Phormidesmis sp.]
MNVLVTGGTGFLGKRLALKLRSHNHQVTILGRNAAIGAQLAAMGMRFVQADLRDWDAIAATCKGQHCVFHCAAYSSPWGKSKTFYDINVLGTRHLVQGCLKHQVQRLIHVSTSAVYFTYAHQLQILESQPFARPVNAYAKTKQLAEQEIAQAQQQGLSTIILRPRGIFGPGDTALLPRLLAASDRTGIPLIHQGKARVDVTYVDNVIDALICAQTAPNSLSGKIYNITNGEPLPLIDLLNRVSRQLEQPLNFRPFFFPVAYGLAAAMESAASVFSLSEPPLTRYTVGLMAFSQTLNIERAIADLGYRPKLSLADGIAKFSCWWKSHSE